jgi:hypothetical protein
MGSEGPYSSRLSSFRSTIVRPLCARGSADAPPTASRRSANGKASRFNLPILAQFER